ncbi:sialidase family protein [Proteiniphilum sp.]|uniref:sialidase family protein n=1 Tax=Proteiniphilum sp. TaxID=1926877 RepID=UPI002B213394|nr:sialidase family protein [Proteiniphilum sp.]MEA4918069.1 sialidase family protein [Proteiniphilum sp.]
MQYIEQIILFPFLFLTLLSCQSKKNYSIEWENGTLICIADEGAYPRMRRLDDNSLIVAYENRRGDVLVKRSFDEGTTWRDPVLAYEKFDYTDEKTGEQTKVNIANPEIVQLDNGDILLSTNLRPRTEGIYPFSIASKKSTDYGVTWSEPTILYQAGTYFRDGCWEPSFLILPNDTLHLYFANEFPYRNSDEQEISVIYSVDNGVSWSREHTTVSFRKNKRDGMPVAVYDGSHIYVAIEDNLSKQFKPYLVKSSVQQAWKEPVLEDSPCRYPALKNPPDDEIYAGAPYQILTDKGLFVLSYQTTENRTSDWELSTMEVVVSDIPSDFRNASQPFDVPLSKEAKWNSLCDLGNNTVAALSSTNFNSDKIGIWMIKGKIIKI